MSAPAASTVDTTPVAARASALTAIALLSCVVFVAVAFGSLRRSPTAGGLFGGVASGAVTAAVYAVGAGWALRKLFVPTPEPAEVPPEAAALQASLGPVLRELETTRIDTALKINRRLATRLPLGLAVGVGGWALTQLGGKPGGWIELATASAFGGGLGWWWAAGALSEQYRKLYKTNVLPRLAAQFGDLAWRPAETPDLKRLSQESLLDAFDDVTAEDEIFGRYRGLPLSIVEVKLTHGSGKEQREVFDGLITRLDLPRGLVGVTAVVGEAGLFNALRRRKDRQPVRMEDPAFERLYEVYGSDQIASRALLTPAFMERFTALGAHPGFGKPLALAVDNRLTIAMPKSGSRNLLEPPGYDKPAASASALVQLHSDLSALFGVADAVIDLDQASRAVAAQEAARG